MTTQAARRRATALITGASAGIGEALARCFAKGGCDLVLVARRTARLKALARTLAAEHSVRAHVATVDLRRPRSVAMLTASLRRRRVQIDILVNNAGIIEVGRFARMTAARSQELIALNVAATTALLSRFLPPMVRRGHGRVLNVCSVASFLPAPTMATYAATKAYLLSLSESLAEELDGTGVTITALCPGVTDTPMKTTIERAHPRVTRLPRLAISDVETVAAEGYLACMRGEVVCVPGLVNQVATLSGRALPRWLVRRVAGAVGRHAT